MNDVHFDNLLSALKTDEGFRDKVYKCPAGYWTVGYGRNLETNGVSRVEAHEMLVHDVIQAQRDAADLVPNWLAIDEVRRNVLTNMSFNMGKGTLSKFKKFLAAVDAKDYLKAAAEMKDSAWYGQVGNRAKRLVREMETGVVV